MDTLDREFALLAASVERTARVQRAEIVHFLETAPRAENPVIKEAQEGSVPDLEPRNGTALASHLLAAYDALIKYVDQQRAEYETLPGNTAKHGAVTEMRKLVAGVRDLHRSLSWLDAARNPPLDLGTRYFVDELVAQLVSANAEVTIVAGERSYGKLSNPFSPVFTLTGVSAPADELPVVVFIPRREKKSGLLHPLIIHEVAHAINDRHSLVSKVLAAAHKDTELVNNREEAATEMGGAAPERFAAAAESMDIRLSYWIEEALCDAFGAQLLGPTYLFAFVAIVGTSNLDRAGEEHPSTRQRIRLLLDQLDEIDWTPLIADEVPRIYDWFRETADIRTVHNEKEEQFCAVALENMAFLIRRSVKSHVNASRFQADKYPSTLKDEIADLLGAGLPPSQTAKGQPIGRASIILGSWLFGIHAKGDDLPALALAPDIPQVSLLLPKALQDGALLTAWKKSEK